MENTPCQNGSHGGSFSKNFDFVLFLTQSYQVPLKDLEE